MKKAYLYPIFQLMVDLTNQCCHSQTASIFPVQGRNRTIRMTAYPGETENHVLRRAFESPHNHDFLTEAILIEIDFYQKNGVVVERGQDGRSSESDFLACMMDLR